MNRKLGLAVIMVLLLLALLVAGCKDEPAITGKQTADWLITKKLTVQKGGAEFQSLLNQAINIENIGLPSVMTAAVTYTSSGALFTVADGEIWIVHRAIINVTTNFDCTGDDCTVDIGDGNDADGFLNLADADLQTTGTDYTGAQAGWQGLDGTAPTGAYIVGGPQVYAPSGAAETIDIAVGGTSPAAGAGTVYLYYTRLQ